MPKTAPFELQGYRGVRLLLVLLNFLFNSCLHSVNLLCLFFGFSSFMFLWNFKLFSFYYIDQILETQLLVEEAISLCEVIVTCRSVLISFMFSV